MLLSFDECPFIEPALESLPQLCFSCRNVKCSGYEHECTDVVLYENFYIFPVFAPHGSDSTRVLAIADIKQRSAPLATTRKHVVVFWKQLSGRFNDVVSLDQNRVKYQSLDFTTFMVSSTHSVDLPSLAAAARHAISLNHNLPREPLQVTYGEIPYVLEKLYTSIPIGRCTFPINKSAAARGCTFNCREVELSSGRALRLLPSLQGVSYRSFLFFPLPKAHAASSLCPLRMVISWLGGTSVNPRPMAWFDCPTSISSKYKDTTVLDAWVRAATEAKYSADAKDYLYGLLYHKYPYDLDCPYDIFAIVMGYAYTDPKPYMSLILQT